MTETITTPVRVQLSREKGWRKPENTVSVAKPSGWANPFTVGTIKHMVNDDDPTDQVWRSTATTEDAISNFRWFVDTPERVAQIQNALRGKNLACRCAPNALCHADVLLEIANRPTTPTKTETP